MPAVPSVRVVVRLPWSRPENPPNDPPRIEWTSEKADILWKVIERSRSSDSGGADWKGLAAHLQVPLPYLLYRVNARFQEEIRGLKDIQGALSPLATQPPSKYSEELASGDKPSSLSNRIAQNNGLTSSSGPTTPLGVRARLNSLGNNSPRPRKAISSSTLTLQGAKKQKYTPIRMRPTSPSSSEADSEDEAAMKEEEADRTAEEQEALDRKLDDLQKMMTNDALGLVISSRPKGKATDRGRVNPSRSLNGSYRLDTLSSRSASQSVSSASSPQGSIPDIPSPPSLNSPAARLGYLSPNKSSSPPVLSARSATGQARKGYGPLISEHGDSSYGSEASSFSDLSDASLSASALESALLSNMHGNTSGSRLSHFARSRILASRSSGIPH